jgi:exosome complex protein LRP1
MFSEDDWLSRLAYLRLNGVQAKEHPVFKELTRVKQYFEKIKVAEAGPTKPRENISLNKQAAGRIIKHALAGNDKYDLERAEREAREKLLARRKLNKFIEKKMPQEQAQDIDETRKDVEVQDDSESESSSEEDDQQDAVMADANTGGQQATTDVPNKSNAQGGGHSRKRRYRDKKKRKNKAPKAASAPITTTGGQAQTLGRKRKKKSRGRREAALGGQAGGFPW